MTSTLTVVVIVSTLVTLTVLMVVYEVSRHGWDHRAWPKRPGLRKGARVLQLAALLLFLVAILATLLRSADSGIGSVVIVIAAYAGLVLLYRRVRQKRTS